MAVLKVQSKSSSVLSSRKVASFWRLSMSRCARTFSSSWKTSSKNCACGSSWVLGFDKNSVLAQIANERMMLGKGQLGLHLRGLEQGSHIAQAPSPFGH